MPKLTKRLIAALQPRAGAYITWDSAVTNFGVRVYPSGQRSYVVTYRSIPSRKSHMTSYVLGSCALLTPEQARDLARQWLVEIRLGADPVAERSALRTAPTMSDLAARYMAEHAHQKKKPGSVRMDRTNLDRHILPRLGKRLVQDITDADIASLQARMHTTPGAANRVLALLSKMFRLAETWHYRPKNTNPVQGIERYPERKMDTFLTGEQLGRLGQVLRLAATEQTEHPSVLAGVWLLLYTGARLDEVLSLRWDYLDWQRGVANLPDSKTDAKPLLLPPPALDLLRALPREAGNPWCLPGRRHGQHLSNPHRPWYRLRAQAGLPGVRLHDLRHTWISMGLRLGIPLELLGRAVGHKHVATTQGYAHLDTDPLSAIAAEVAARLQQALGG